jgi:hypothetical protein
MITHRSPTDELHTYDQYRKRAVDKVGYQVEQNRTDSLEMGELRKNGQISIGCRVPVSHAGVSAIDGPGLL